MPFRKKAGRKKKDEDTSISGLPGEVEGRDSVGDWEEAQREPPPIGKRTPKKPLSAADLELDKYLELRGKALVKFGQTRENIVSVEGHIFLRGIDGPEYKGKAK